MNSCNFLGRLTEDPVVHTGFNGTPVVNLELEIEEFRTDSRGDKRRHCTYVDVEAWDTAATTIEKYAKAGCIMSVESVARNCDD